MTQSPLQFFSNLTAFQKAKWLLAEAIANHATYCNKLQVAVSILSLLVVSFLLRILFIGNTFQSSDNAELAWKILKNSGYSWIIHDYYGALIDVVVKLFVGLLSTFGITITEFWWKVPIAILGSFQAPLTYFFLKRRIGCSDFAAWFGAISIAILPIHVFLSRYLYGYEVFGVFFVTLAIWKLLDFFETPTLTTGLLGSFFAGLYLISHGYIIPFVPCLIVILVLFGPAEQSDSFRRFTDNVKSSVRHLLWLFPLLLYPLYISSIRHALQKPTRLGFYLQDHLPGFIENTGYGLVLLLVLAISSSILGKRFRTKHSILFIICSASYLAPLLFGTPKGITVIRPYMLLSTYFLILSAAIALDKWESLRRRSMIVLIFLCFMVTLWGTVESVYGRDEMFDPSGVKIEYGGISRDPGSKAAGFLIRKYVKPSEKVLAIHGAVEPPNLFYYFGRSQYSFFDLPRRQAVEKLRLLRDKVDVIICSEVEAPLVESSGTFVKRVVLSSENQTRMLIYAKPYVELPLIVSDVRPLNHLFDREYAWQVSLR